MNNLAANIDRDNPGDRLSQVKHASAGIPLKVDDTLYVIPWNNADVFEKLCKEHGHEIAAILMNPIDYNNGCIGSSMEYMQAIRRICDEHGIIFIIDEILSGFRTGLTGGHGYYSVTPDLCLFGKALTNGIPLAVVAGKEKIMMKIMDPVNPVVAGGTFSGNLFGCAAGSRAPNAPASMENPVCRCVSPKYGRVGKLRPAFGEYGLGRVDLREVGLVHHAEARVGHPFLVGWLSLGEGRQR